jgi:hypothetical protein
MDTNRRKLKNVDEASSFVLLLALTILLTSCGPKIEKPKLWWPGELTLSTHTHGGTICVGDPYWFQIEAIYPTNHTVILPEIGREKEIVVLDRQWSQEPYTNGHTRVEVTYSLTSFRIGDHIICTEPAIYLHNGITETNRFPDTHLSVRTSLPDDSSSEIADIKPVHKLPGRVPRWLWVALGTAVTAFLIGVISSRLWKNREMIVPQPPPLPPHVIAFRALEALKNKGLLEKDGCNPFYTELSAILRNYLEGRFRLNAPEETTEEIVEEMSRSNELNGLQRNILQDFLRQADIVKFAKGHPDRTTMESAFNTTKQFVEETKLIKEHDD